MFKEGISQNEDPAQYNGGGTGPDFATETNEQETALSYDSIFKRVKELGHVEDPQSYARSIIWRRYYDLVRNGMVTYDELFHEAVVGMYMAIQDGNPVEQVDVFRSVSRQLQGYKCAVIGRKQNIPFSQLEGDDSEISGEEMADKLRFRIKLEQVEDDTQEAVMEDDFITDLMRQSRQIIIKNGENVRMGQGQRDWEVFVRYLTGDRIEEICVFCPWLTSVDSVEKALQRIILTLRENIAGATDASTTVNLISEGRINRIFQQESRYDTRQYYSNWYRENGDPRRAQVRDYMRRKRENAREEKKNKLQETQS